MKTIPIDPTANVLQLVHAAIDGVNARLDLHAKLNDQAILHLEKEGELRAEHAKEIRDFETSRVNADRRVADLEAEKIRATLQTTAATLATQQSALAESVNGRLLVLERASSEGKGKGVGMSQFYGWLVGAVALALAIANYLRK